MTWGVWDICPYNIRPYYMILAQDLYGPNGPKLFFDLDPTVTTTKTGATTTTY